jgi:Lrp/AsnC family transcriptional regulator, leucine-responsive regulatory protein
MLIPFGALAVIPTEGWRLHDNIDDTDCRVLILLQQRGRLTQTELAGTVGLSLPALGERLRRLEARGIIQGYFARVNPEAVGLGLLAFVRVSLAGERYRAAEETFLAAVAADPAIQECHHVAGEDSFLLKVRAAGTAGLARLIAQLKTLPGVERTNTLVVLDTAKETTALPIPLATDA